MCGAHKLILLFLVTLIILHAMFLVTHSNSRKQGKSSHKTCVYSALTNASKLPIIHRLTAFVISAM